MSEPMDPQRHNVLSPDERARAFGVGLSDDQYAAALKTPHEGIPRKVIVWAAVTVAVLGLGGAVLERVVGNGAAGSATSTTLPGVNTAAQSAPSGPSINSSLSSYLGLRNTPVAPAPAFTGLLTSYNSPFTFAGERGHAVVVTFFNSTCTDICPIESREISTADALLGANASKVRFVIVNTDPTSTSVLASPPALNDTGLAAKSNVSFLNGPLTSLNRVWTDYRIRVTVAQNGTMAHNNVMYFVDPAGQLRQLAIPFADLNSSGISTLSTGQISRYATGISQTVKNILSLPS